MAESIKAWLITWEWTRTETAVSDRVAGILNPLWGMDRVADIVEFLYAHEVYTLEEMAYSYGKYRGHNPYEVERVGSHIICGHNPYLFARKVENLTVERDSDTDKERATWVEREVYEWDGRKSTVTRGKMRDGFVRQRNGNLEHILLWDIEKGQLKNDWDLPKCMEKELLDVHG